MSNIWREVGLGRLHCAVAGALSNVVIGMMKKIQYEMAMDYPDCTYYRAIIKQLVRNGDDHLIGDNTPPHALFGKSLSDNRQIAVKAKGDAAAIEENLLLTTHNDIVSFITNHRENRIGKLTATYPKTNSPSRKI